MYVCVCVCVCVLLVSWEQEEVSHMIHKDRKKWLYEPVMLSDGPTTYFFILYERIILHYPGWEVSLISISV